MIAVTGPSGGVRIVLLAAPRSLRQLILDTVATETNLEIVGELEEVTRPLTASFIDFVSAHQPNFAVVGMDIPACDPQQRTPEPTQSIMDTLSGGVVLAVSPDGRSGCLYESRPGTTPLGELSPKTLVATIRQLTARPR